MSIRIRNGHVLAESCRLAKLAADDAGPKWNKLFPLGTRFRSDFPDGKADFTPDFLGTMLRNWTDADKPALPVDYFHRGPTYEEGANEDKVASGWIEDLELRDDGLWGLIKWTDDARALILADKLRYLSPMFAFNAKSRMTGKLQGPTLGGAGLLNDPFLQDLPAVAASGNVDPSRGGTDIPSRAHEVVPVHQKICAALGLDPTSSEDTVMAHLSKRLGGFAGPDADKKMAALTAEFATAQTKLAANEGALKLANEQISKLQTDLAKRDTDAKEAAINETIAKLTAGGHIIAEQKDRVIAYAKATSPAEAWETFSKFSTAPMKEVGNGGEGIKLPDSPAAAFAQIVSLAEKRAADKKITLTAAKLELYDEPALQPLVALANRNHANEKRNS